MIKKLQINFVTKILLFTILVLTSCKKDENLAPNDGASSNSLIKSIIGKRWYRETDKIVYSFELASNGDWVTYRGCQSIIEGTWEIDYQTSKLYHIFNGQQEEYGIIDPSSNTVKFKGGTNSSSDIAAQNVLLVYSSSYKNSNYIAKNATYTVQFHHQSIDGSVTSLRYFDIPSQNYITIDKNSNIYLFGETTIEPVQVCCSNVNVNNTPGPGGTGTTYTFETSYSGGISASLSSYPYNQSYSDSKISFATINNENFIIYGGAASIYYKILN